MKPLNEKERPRVLLLVDEYLKPRFDFLKPRTGTYKTISHLSDVDLSEWDALITDRSLVQFGPRLRDRKDNGSKHLSVLQIFGRDYQTLETLEGDVNQLLSAAKVVSLSAVPGHHVYLPDVDLSDETKRPIKVDLQLTTSKRAFQFGIEIEKATPEQYEARGIRPHLIGPNGLIMSADITKSNGTSMWLTPMDVSDFEPWWDLALQRFHELRPEVFPGVPNWTSSPDWMTFSEKLIHQSIADEISRFALLETEHQERLAILEDELRSKSADAQMNEQVLLCGQDFELQVSVQHGLERLGYRVRDMDAAFPSREPREDYRITDPDDDNWLAIGDATGVAKGAKGAKIQALAGYVQKYLIEDKPDVMPYQWLLVNRKIGYDPETRGEIYRKDEVDAFASNQGLAFDTVALFLLLQIVDEGSATPGAVRSWLREKTGQLLISDVRQWRSEIEK